MKDAVEILAGAVGGFVLGGLFARSLYMDVVHAYDSAMYEIRAMYDKAKAEIESLVKKV